MTTTPETVEAAKYLSEYAFFNFMEIFVLVLLIVLAMIWLTAMFRKPSSTIQRERMTDLYVVGMIRKFCKRDGIDLEEEMMELKKLWKLDRMRRDKLDKTIERELQEKITKQIQNKISDDKEEKK